MKSLIFTLILFSTLFLNCKKTVDNTFDIQGTGKIEQLQSSYYMYGTHTIEIKGKLYALSSKNLDLEIYNNQTVTIWGNIMVDYPVTNGPTHVEVIKISK